MREPEMPKNERERLAALHRYEILDTQPEAAFDDLAELAAYVAHTPWALVTLIDTHRQWIKAAHGLDVRETERRISFCGHLVASGQPLCVGDARSDERFADNPLVTGPPNIGFYAGFPLRTPDGHVLGALCVLDERPRVLDDGQLQMLAKLADRVMTALELRRQNKQLQDEQHELVASKQRLARANELATAVTTTQNSYLVGEPIAQVFGRMLEQFLELSDSSFGFLGEVHVDDDGQPYLQTHAISNIAWDQASRDFYAAHVGPGFEFRNLDTLFGATLRTGQEVLSNSPTSDARAGGLPPGHPPLHAYLGIPVTRGNTLLGMIGLANRPRGYDDELVEFLQPLVATCGGLIETCRADAERRAATRELERALESLRRSHDELASFLNLLSVGTMVVGSQAEVLYLSQTCMSLAGLECEVLGQTWARVLPVDARACDALRLCVSLPESERSRIGARLGVGEAQRYVEIDVRDDPRSQEQRIFFIYDVTELYERAREAVRAGHGLVGGSPAMQELHGAIEQVAAGTWTVLIEGETGTGKELIARAIHEASARRRGPFVAVNCAGLTDTLLGSQLFGHVKGAFTGAISSQPGLFEAASGGSIFLDEIGDISLGMQRALLRVLQEREVTRVGETMPRKVDVRIIAATHRDIQAMTRRGEFREDLLYRVRIARIAVAPLRSRLEDIPALIDAFLANAEITGGKTVRAVDPVALGCLSHHEWPGNVRELRGVIEYAVVHCRENTIRVWDLPPEFQAHASRTDGHKQDDAGERQRILDALRVAGGNRSKAAKLLGIGRATLYRRLDALDLDQIG